MRTVRKSTTPTHKPTPSSLFLSSSFSLSLSLSLSLSRSLSFLSLSLSLCRSLCCVLRHHCDAAVMVRCDMLAPSLLVPMCVCPHSAVQLSLSLSLLSLSLSFSLFILILSLSFSFSVCCLSRHHCDTIVMVRCDMISSSLLVPMRVCPHSAVELSLSLSLLGLSLSFSLFILIFSLSFSFSVCCLSRHHCDTIVIVRCDVISLTLFWSPCVSS